MKNSVGWKTVKLDNLVERLTNGYVGATRGIYQEQGIPYLLARHIKSNNLKFDGKTYVTEEFNQQKKKSILKTGDILLVQSGHIGESAVVPPEHQGHNCHALIVITPKHEKLDSNYLSRYFSSSFGKAQFRKIQTGITLKHLNCRDVKKLAIPLPPLEEQKRIAAILDKADAIRRKRKKAIALTEELLRSTFLDMFGDLFAFLKGYKENHPKGWLRTKLGEQLTLQRGFDLTKKQCQEGKYPVISSGGISAYHSEYKDSSPGVLLGRKGSVGKVHYVDENYWPHDTTLWVRDFKGNNPRFIYYFFKLFPISMFEASTANPTLNRNRLHPLDVFWPPVENQLCFSSIVDLIIKSEESKLNASSESENLFNSLLQKAFRGEL